MKFIKEFIFKRLLKIKEKAFLVLFIGPAATFGPKP